jgi:hypothetical protein
MNRLDSVHSKNAFPWAGIVLLLITGVIHLNLAKAEYAEAPYLGILFFAAFYMSLVAAIGIFRGEFLWGWGLGGLIALASCVGYLLSRTVGLPISGIEPWGPATGYLSLLVEAFFIVQFLLERPWNQIPVFAKRMGAGSRGVL